MLTEHNSNGTFQQHSFQKSKDLLTSSILINSLNNYFEKDDRGPNSWDCVGMEY